MDTARWERIQDLFHRAVDLPHDEQAALLNTECGGDDRLRDEVQALLRGDAHGQTLLDRDVAHVAHAVLGVADGAAIPRDAFGPYRVTRLLGEGGMGVVYLAERADLASTAAIKILRDAWLSPARRDRFLAEQRTLAQLNHPGIARLFDAGALADGTPWIAMEYVEGVPLGDYCRSRNAPLRERLRLTRAVCEAVQHAHQHLVIHRDLKPSNVLIRPDGSVKLLDFGIAKHLEGPDATPDSTRTGLRLMTPAYAAPEQILGRQVSVHTDVYSLGVMLYELLAGVLPFDLSDKTPGQAETIIVEQDPARPSTRATALPATRGEWADLDVLCLTAMHKDPARRYQSVDALVRDIDHFLGGEPLDARPDALRYRAGKFARRHARGLTTAAVLTAAAITLVTFYTVRLANARDLALIETARAQRIQRFMTNLFQGGDEAAGPAESLRVVTLLDQGVREARRLDQEPAVQADLYQTLGGIYRQVGKLDLADSLLQTALAKWKTLGDPSGPEVPRSMVAVADLRTDQARYDEADTLLRGALATLRRVRPSDASAIGDALVTLGRSLTERGEHDKAIAVLDSAVGVLSTTGAETPETMRALGELANAHFYAGNYDQADSLNRRILVLTRRLYGANHPLVAEDLMNLGATEQERGNYASSEGLFREALAITLGFYGEDHYRTAGNLVNLGRSLLLQNRYPEAREVFERALRIRERVFGVSHPGVANVLNEIGSVALREERYDDAEIVYERVRRIYVAAYPGRNFRVGVATANLADVYLNRREFTRAEPLYRDALAHYIASQGPDHLNTGIGYIKLGRCLMRAGRFREAEPETQRGYAIVAKVASPGVNFLQAARLDLSIMYDSLGQPERAAKYRAEREQYLPKPATK